MSISFWFYEDLAQKSRANVWILNLGYSQQTWTGPTFDSFVGLVGISEAIKWFWMLFLSLYKNRFEFSVSTNLSHWSSAPRTQPPPWSFSIPSIPLLCTNNHKWDLIQLFSWKISLYQILPRVTECGNLKNASYIGFNLSLCNNLHIHSPFASREDFESWLSLAVCHKELILYSIIFFFLSSHPEILIYLFCYAVREWLFIPRDIFSGKKKKKEPLLLWRFKHNSCFLSTPRLVMLLVRLVCLKAVSRYLSCQKGRLKTHLSFWGFILHCKTQRKWKKTFPAYRWYTSESCYM